MADQTASSPGPPTGAQPAVIRNTGTGAFAPLVALCALLVAAGAGAVAVYALNEARQAKSQAAIAVAGRTPTTPAVTRTTSSPSASSTRSDSPAPTATPTSGFIADHLQSPMHLPPASGCASVYVDVDTLKVGIAEGHEFYLTSCLGPQALRIDRTAAAAPTATVSTPEACAALLAGIQNSAELILAVRPGLTFCLMTNTDDAAKLGQPQRLALVEVRSVAADSTVTLVVSTYRVPANP